MIDGSDVAVIEANVAAWKALESEWYPEDGTFVGCGYEGTSDGLNSVRFGDGCDDCLSATNAYADPLLWLWITIPTVLVAGTVTTILLLTNKP
jgi:hypothetical protein